MGCHFHEAIALPYTLSCIHSVWHKLRKEKKLLKYIEPHCVEEIELSHNDIINSTHMFKNKYNILHYLIIYELVYFSTNQFEIFSLTGHYDFCLFM